MSTEPTTIHEMEGVKVYHGDCLKVMATLPTDSINLIVADPPYFQVKDLPWDRQWDTSEGFLAWIGRLCAEWQRVLRPNGSLYVFASPRMAARVEVEIGKWFNVLNSIVWVKPDPFSSINRGASNSGRMCKDTMRQYYPNTERIIFAEHFGADNMANGEAGYAAKCDELRGFVFEPILRYLIGQFEASKLSRREVDEHFGTSNVSQYWLQPRGFIIPTVEKWAGLQYLRPDHFRREYEDLRREYEDLRREYEDLRRPFAISADVPYTDVWDFPTVQSYPGKHPCEKPPSLINHIVACSSIPGDVILDPFLGSGVTGEACRNLGRQFIGIEQDIEWVKRAFFRIKATDTMEFMPVVLQLPTRRKRPANDMPLFTALESV